MIRRHCCWPLKWNRVAELDESEPFSLPSPLPQWPQGGGFAAGTIRLGEIEVCKITKFEAAWSFNPLRGKRVTFYRPMEIPDGFHCLGYYCQANDRPLRGYVLVAREVAAATDISESSLPALSKPLGYTLLWGEEDPDRDVSGFLWMPEAPAGYRATGIVVTDKPEKPELEEVRCVREDLTKPCEAYDLICSMESKSPKGPFRVWNTRPFTRGMWESGVSVGTFFSSSGEETEDIGIACLRNGHDSLRSAMPNLDQVHAVVKHYGPMIYFHQDEAYFPSSVQWFFKNGALLYRDGDDSGGVKIDHDGSNLPAGGINDGEFWLDLPDTDDEDREFLKRGNLESTELYVHVKPALGGTFTDIAMWVFCPFNGPATLKVGPVSVTMTRIGEHVGDWEHFTLRVSNFDGELYAAYFSQHNGGRWVDASDLEFVEGNKAAVYSSKGGHASFPHPGSYLLGSTKLGVGIRNDAARSDFFVDSSTRYRLVAAEYLGNDEAVKEPQWLQYMRQWGPTVEYDSKSELNKVAILLRLFLRVSVQNIFDFFPTELYGEKGPLGPKQKNNWVGDEIE